MNNFYSALYTIVLLFAITISGLAQSRASLNGMVRDAGTKEVLIGANVYLLGTSIGTITDARGSFSLSGVTVGNHTLVISYIGYESYEEQFQAEAGEKIQKDIKLQYSGGVDLEEVVITAQARGQLEAINTQLRASDIKNVVSAERIRELPDANAAESLGRLPGVSVQRSGGEGSKVVVRGLSPKYSKITLDGVEMASTGETFRSSSSTAGTSFSTLTSGQEDRSVNLNMISSYSLEGIEVVKSHTADRDADFIGGAVNFKMRTAPTGFNTEVIALLGYNSLGNTFNDYNLNATVSNRFFENKLGVFIQGNAEKRNRSAQTLSLNHYFLNSGLDPETGEGIYERHVINNVFMSDVHRIRTRRGGALVLDYKLPGGFIAFKNNISSSGDDAAAHELRVRVDHDSKQTSMRSRYLDENRLSYSSMLQYEQRLSSFLLDGSLSYSYASTSAPDENEIQGFDEFLITSSEKDPPEDIIADVMENASNTADYSLLNVTKNSNDTYQGQYEASLNAEWFFTITEKISGSLKAGGRYQHKERVHDYEYFDSYLGEGADQALDSLELMLPDLFPQEDSLRGPYGDGKMSFAPFLDNNYSPSGNFLKKYGEFPRGASEEMIIATYDAIAQAFPLSKQDLYHNTYKRHASNSEKFDYRGYEDYTAAYLMGTFRITSYVDLIPGVRFEQNKSSYTAKRGNSQSSGQSHVVYRDVASAREAIDTTTYRTNQYFLPSVHLKVKPTKWLQFHAAYTNTLSRPDFTRIVPKLDITERSVDFNTYYLEPEESSNFDFVTSVHHNYVGLFSANLFAKRIDNKIVHSDMVIGDFYKVMNVDETFAPKIMTHWYNDTANTVEINGIELEWQTNFWYLPGLLKGIVLNINYTHIMSKATYIFTEIGIDDSDPFNLVRYEIDHSYESRLIDQPSDILNIALGYDYKGFSGRISLYYQSDVFTGNSFFSHYRSFQPTYYRFDLSIKQDLPVKGLQVFLNLNNINRAVEVRYVNGYQDFPSRMEYYGMSGDIGLKWIFNQ